MIALKFLVGQYCPYHLHRDWTFLEYPIVKFTVAHFFTVYKVVMEGIKLQPAHHIRDLIERSVVAGKRATDLGGGVVAFVTHTIDEKIDRFLRRHFLQVKIQTEDDPLTSMHPPEKRADAVFRSFLESLIP